MNDRRAFLQETIGKALQHIAQHAEERVAPKRWFRPPGAAPEVTFVAACTRCGDCIDVCPVQCLTITRDGEEDDLRKRLGLPQRRERSMWEWTKGRRFIRLNWRGGRGWRVISITLNDRDVMDRIARYLPKPKPK